MADELNKRIAIQRIYTNLNQELINMQEKLLGGDRINVTITLNDKVVYNYKTSVPA